MNDERNFENQNLAEERLQELQNRIELENMSNFANRKANESNSNFSNRLNNIRNNASSLANNHSNIINNTKSNSGVAKSNENSLSNQSKNNSLNKSDNNMNRKGNLRSKANSAAQKAAIKYLKSKGVPEWASKLALNRNRSKGLPGVPGLMSPKQLLANPFGNLLGKKSESESLKNEERTINFGLSMQLIKTIGIITPFVFLGLCVFICLFIGTQTYVNAKKLQHAYSSEQLEDYMNENMTDEEKEEEIDQDSVDNIDNSSAFYFIDNTKSNFVMVARKAEKYKTAEMDELKDYYSYVDQYDENIDEELVYKFFFKIDFLKKYYKKNYQGVELDIPLLMSTLILQSDDMNEVFKSNTKGFSYKSCRSKQQDGYDYSGCWDKDSSHRLKYIVSYANLNFSYDHDWSNYNISYKNSQHDMEILAQHMISYQATESCVDSSGKVVSTNIIRDNELGTQVLTCGDGESYRVSGSSYGLDDEKYNEFLKEFLEKKYVLNYDADYEEDSSSGISGTSVSANFTKYTFEGDLLEQIASVCYREQGSAKGAAAEASLIANRFEYSDVGRQYQQRYGKTGLGLYHYLLESGWWGNPSSTMSAKSASTAAVNAVRSVLEEGKRTLPRYVDEHDCWDCNPQSCSDGKRGDICSLNTNGRVLTSMSDIRKRANYVQNTTIVKNVYGANYTFYSFPTSNSDPFGYLSERLRQTVGECYYDFDNNKFVNCGSSFVSTFISWLKSIAEDDSHGYSQYHRESLIDFDCASLVYFGLLNSGFNTEQLGTTAFRVSTSMPILKRNGFEEIKFSDLVPDGHTTTNLMPGDILVADSHTEVYIGEGMNVGAHMSETGGITGEYGDQNGREISITNFWNDNWLYVYRYRG